LIQILRATRPKQWIKNLLVFAVPLASGDLGTSNAVFKSLCAFITFTVLSAATYLINDIRDVAQDQLHPKKKNRPIASGQLSIRRAMLASIALGVAGISLPVFFGLWNLFVVLSAYAILQAAYQLVLKNIALIDLVVVSSGFVLRAMAGGLAAGILISPWFITVTAASAMFIVSGKRFCEFRNHGEHGETRNSLRGYTESYLRMLWTSSMGLALVFYVLWSVEIGGDGKNWLALLTALPFSLVMLRYAQHVDSGEAESPEDVVLGDAAIQVLVLIWALLFAVRVFS
jgi:decaprenyl-phosphate phosphoribosyltransferase